MAKIPVPRGVGVPMTVLPKVAQLVSLTQCMCVAGAPLSQHNSIWQYPLYLLLDTLLVLSMVTRHSCRGGISERNHVTQQLSMHINPVACSNFKVTVS